VPEGSKGRRQQAGGNINRKAHVVELTEAKLKQLQAAGDNDVDLQCMISSAQTLDILAALPHAAVLVSQGLLLVAIKAITWDVHPDLNQACISIVQKLAGLEAAYLQMVRGASNVPMLLVLLMAALADRSESNQPNVSVQALEAGACEALTHLLDEGHDVERSNAEATLSILAAGVPSSPCPAQRMQLAQSRLELKLN
jgi:hypothetical protein